MNVRLITLICAGIVCIVGCDAFKNSPRPLAKTAAFEMYAASASPTPGSKNAIDPATNAQFYLTTPAILTATDVETIQRSGDPSDMPSLTVNLTPTGSTKLAVATANPAGMQVAVFVNGTLVAAPTLSTTLTNSFRVTGDEIAKNREQLFASLTDE